MVPWNHNAGTFTNDLPDGMRVQFDGITSHKFLRTLDVTQQHFGVYRCTANAKKYLRSISYDIKFIEKGLPLKQFFI